MLVDCDFLTKYKPIDNKPINIPKNYKLGLLLKVAEHNYQKLCSCQKGEQRVNYFLNPEFQNNILFSCFCFYDKKKELCMIEDKQNLFLILSIIRDTLPSTTIIWTKIDVDNKALIDEFINNGFENPYIKDNKLVLFKKNKNSVSNQSLVSNKIKNLKTNSTHCHLYVRLSEEAVSFLKSLSDKGYSKNKDGSSSQKELSGDLVMKDAIQVNNDIVYIIDINHSSIASGEEEEVKVGLTRYNFHSHPRQAYIRHSVHKAWPSVIDFKGCITLGVRTIFHCVATIEGLYIISFNKYWHSKVHELSSSFIEENFNIHPGDNMSPQEYVSRVNNITKDNHPIFKLYFLTWDYATTPLEIEYSPIEGICFVNQESIDFHKKNFS